MFKPTHRHYKGNLYEVLFLAINTIDGSLSVVYRNEVGDYYVRPATDFNALISVDDKIIPRFETLVSLSSDSSTKGPQ